MFIVVGLGNPGQKYEKTRHNVGFRTIDRLAEQLNIKVNKGKWNGLYGEGNHRGEKIVLVKPQTYMNNSGDCVRQIYKFFGVEASDLIVITDDIDIEFGTVRVKSKGSAGSHNGLKSIVSSIGTKDFPRVKISVGKKPDYMDLADFVLSTFPKKDADVVGKEIDLASEAVMYIIEDGVDKAMNEVNSVNLLG